MVVESVTSAVPDRMRRYSVCVSCQLGSVSGGKIVKVRNKTVDTSEWNKVTLKR